MGTRMFWVFWDNIVHRMLHGRGALQEKLMMWVIGK